MLSEPSDPEHRDDAGAGAGAGQRSVLFGLLSFGLEDCALRSAPLVHTRVAHYVPWILRHLKPNPFVPKDRSTGSGQVDPRLNTMHGYAQH